MTTHAPDYTTDGLLYCGNCHTAKQLVVPFPKMDGTGEYVDRIVPRMCDCRRAEHDKAEHYFRMRQQQQEMDRKLARGYLERDLRSVTFGKADPDGENIDKARDYVARFGEFREDGIGLMFYGPVGNGKTWAAACIANALIEQGIPVAVFTTATFMGLDFEARADLIKRHKEFPLIVLDDFGVERSTEYAMEQIYNLIDERYKSELPMIVTTNLLPSEMEQTEDINKKRIYDRVLEMCAPVRFTGESRRKARRAEKLAAAKQIFLR